MAVLSREQAAQAAYEAGWRGDALVGIVAIMGRESSYKTDAHRTDRDPSALSGDMGLTQVNYTNTDALKQAGIIRSNQDLFDPVTNLRAAKFLYDQFGWFPWNMTSSGWNANGDPFYGTDRNAAAQAVERADLGSGFSMSSSAGSPTATPAATGPTRVPSDAHLITVDNERFIAFDVGQGVRLAYRVGSAGVVEDNIRNRVSLSKEQWNSYNITMAGDVEELGTLSDTFPSFKEFWDSIVDQVVGPYNPARNDPEILRAIADFAARPDMTESELQNNLQRTQWYRDRSQAQLDWNGLSPGEQERQIENAASSIADMIFELEGVEARPDDKRVLRWAKRVASGEIGWGELTYQFKDAALANEESPWARTVREEEEAQRQRPIDIENTGERIRETLQRWGVRWTPREINRWARKIVENEASDADLMDAVKKGAAALYPWKDPEQETIAAAQPWLETYDRLMEKNGTLQTREIQRALTQGTPVFEFEQDLRKTDEWALGTKNGRDELSGIASEVGRRMGFN